MGELVERAFTEQRLLEAWSEVRDAALADGDAGPEVERFEAAAARHVSELAEALGGGTFQPHPVGFLHWARWGRPCLALDLIEEFRPVIVDAVVLRCLSTGIVRFEEFETTLDRGCRMNARARQVFLAAYERRMLTVFTHEPTGRRVSQSPARYRGHRNKSSSEPPLAVQTRHKAQPDTEGIETHWWWRSPGAR